MQSDLAKRVLRDISRQGMLRAGDDVGVGVSAGADSVALLRLLLEIRDELGIRLTVLHFNHQLRGAESDADEQFVAALAAERGIPFLVGRGDVSGEAREQGLNLEDAARRLRYAYFNSVIATGAVARVAVAHTADDQAETVLARLVRGTGPAGLAAIYPVVSLDEEVAGGAATAAMATGPLRSLVRPLLEVRRGELREYLEHLGQSWHEDPSNRDTQRLRARLRHQILPLIERELQPAITTHLGRLAQMAREDEAFWGALIKERLTSLVHREEGVRENSERKDDRLAVRCAELLAPLSRPVGAQSQDARMAVARRLVRGLVEELRGDCRDLTAQHVEQVLRLAEGNSSDRSTHLPGVVVERSFEWLWFYRAADQDTAKGGNGASELEGVTPVKDEYFHAVKLGSSGESTVIVVPEIGRRFRLKVIDWPSLQEETNIESHALDRDLLCAPLVLRNWRAGDSFRPRGRGSVHKLKHFLRAGRVGVRDRAGWPVLTSNGQLVWARGLPVAAEFAPGEQTRAGVVIAEEEI